MLPAVEHISNLIERQFPSFYREEGPMFITFVKAYYEWMEEQQNTLGVSRNLYDTRDIDYTAEKFVDYFSKKYLYSIPKQIAGDKRFLEKHILDVYRAKGSIEGLKLFFRLLYNEEVVVYVPSVDILKPSDGQWVEKKYIEATYTKYNPEFQYKLITGSESGATAFVETFVRTFSNDRILNIFYLSNIQGNFIVGERITYEGLDFNDAPKILGSPILASVEGTDTDFNVGDIILPANGTGSGIKLQVSGTRIAGSANATIKFKILNGGSGYTINPTISITTGANTTGNGATFSGVLLSNTYEFEYSTSFIYGASYYPITETIDSQTAVNSTSDFITVSNNHFVNNELVLYYTSANSAPISGLANNTKYWIVSANTTGFKLSTTRGGANIDITASSNSYPGQNFYRDAVLRIGKSDVNSTSDFISMSIGANNKFANGDYVTYLTETGNTAITGLSNGSNYYVVAASNTGLKLATGNSTTYNTTPIDLTSGTAEYGHILRVVPLANIALNAPTYGSYLYNANLSTIIGDALDTEMITVGTISQLTGVNIGNGYDGYINISITEPKTAGYNIPDGKGGTLGLNAAIAGNVELGVGLANQLVVKNSGFGYHTKSEIIELYNSTQSNTEQKVKANLTLGAVGFKEGYWDSSRGFIDSDKYVQDSTYYQEYSYEIRFKKSVDKYIDVLKQLVHPAGNKVFGRTQLLQKTDREQVGAKFQKTVFRFSGAALYPPIRETDDVFTLDISRLV